MVFVSNFAKDKKYYENDEMSMTVNWSDTPMMICELH